MLKIMATNGKGWSSVGKDLPCSPTGHETDAVGIMLTEELVVLEVGDFWDARTKSDAREMNQALHAQGWISETNHDFRMCPNTGARIDIARNFRTDNGVFIRARFERTG